MGEGLPAWLFFMQTTGVLMMKKMIAASVLSLSCWAGSAQAATTITFDPLGLQALGTTVYQTFDTAATPVGSSIGTNAFVFSSTGAGAGTAVTPAVGSTGNFGAVLAGGSFTTTFALPTSVFSFVLGSLDSYNSLLLRYADGSTTTLFGNAIAGLPTLNTKPSGTVSYTVTSGPLLTGATFGSAVNSFEFDNLSTAVPEPAAWGMMILGFGLVGGAMRRRSAVKVSKVSKVSFA